MAAVRELARRSLLRRARPVAAERGRAGLLVLAPHPDDETLGCGARIAAARRHGIPVTVVVATDGAASHGPAGPDRELLVRRRSQELLAAADRLGVPATDVVQLGLPDGELAAHQAALAASLRELIGQRQPAEVYTTCSAEWHPDHAAAGRATAEAVTGLSQPPDVLEYPIWLWADWPLSCRHGPWRGMWDWLSLLAAGAVETFPVADLRELKRAALDAYASQLGGAVSPKPTAAGLSGSLGPAEPAAARQAGSPAPTDPATAELPPEVLARALAGPELFFRRPPTGR